MDTKDEEELQLDWNSSSDSNENMSRQSCEVMTTIEDDNFIDDMSEAIKSKDRVRIKMNSTKSNKPIPY